MAHCMKSEFLNKQARLKGIENNSQVTDVYRKTQDRMYIIIPKLSICYDV